MARRRSCRCPPVEGAGVVQGCRACGLSGHVVRRCSCRGPPVEGAGVVQGCRACDPGGEVERRCSCRCPPVGGWHSTGCSACGLGREASSMPLRSLGGVVVVQASRVACGAAGRVVSEGDAGLRPLCMDGVCSSRLSSLLPLRLAVLWCWSQGGVSLRHHVGTALHRLGARRAVAASSTAA